MLAACTTVGPDFKAPATPSVQSYAMAGDPIARQAALTPEIRQGGAWWRALGSADLDRIMTEALAGSPTLRQANATLDKARAQAAVARGETQPKVDLAASDQGQRINLQAFGFAGVTNPTINLLSLGGAVSYDLDLYGGGRRRVETASAVLQAQARRADAAYLTLTGNVALQAVRIAALRDHIQALQAVIADDRQSLEIARRAEAAGGASPASLSTARSRLAEDEAAAPAVEQELSEARHALALLVGKPPAAWTAPPFRRSDFSPPKSTPVVIPSTLVRGRPDILAAEADLHADTARIGVATADLYPDVKLVAGLTQSTITPKDLFNYAASGWYIGPTLTLPLFNGGALKARRAAAEAQARVSLAQYEQTVLAAFVQVANVLSALAHDDERLSAVQRAQTSAAGALRDAQAGYRLGGRPLVDVVEARGRWDRARIDTIDAESRRLLDLVQLFAATACDWTRPSPDGRAP